MRDQAPETTGAAIKIDDLMRAISGGELFLLYQPRIALPSWRITGAEALVRWRHPERGAILPGVFIPLAEATGLISDLTRWVATEAVRQCHAWREEGLDVSVAINA